jgi:hypothetical protein
VDHRPGAPQAGKVETLMALVDLMRFAAAFGRLADVLLVFGNRNDGFDSLVGVFREVLLLQGLSFLYNRIECAGNVIGTHVIFPFVFALMVTVR